MKKSDRWWAGRSSCGNPEKVSTEAVTPSGFPSMTPCEVTVSLQGCPVEVNPFEPAPAGHQVIFRSPGTYGCLATSARWRRRSPVGEALTPPPWRTERRSWIPSDRGPPSGSATPARRPFPPCPLAEAPGRPLQPFDCCGRSGFPNRRLASYGLPGRASSRTGGWFSRMSRKFREPDRYCCAPASTGSGTLDSRSDHAGHMSRNEQ